VISNNIIYYSILSIITFSDNSITKQRELFAAPSGIFPDGIVLNSVVAGIFPDGIVLNSVVEGKDSFHRVKALPSGGIVEKG